MKYKESAEKSIKIHQKPINWAKHDSFVNQICDGFTMKSPTFCVLKLSCDSFYHLKAAYYQYFEKSHLFSKGLWRDSEKLTSFVTIFSLFT